MFMIAMSIVARIFRLLRKLPDGPRRIYFDSEFDGNQTKFEMLSNTLQIGVLARDLGEATVLLTILRGIIDGYDAFERLILEDIAREYMSEKEYYDAPESIIDDKIDKHLSNAERNETDTTWLNCIGNSNTVWCPDDDERIVTELYTGSENITKYKRTIATRKEDIDLWSLDQIEKHFAI